jgi:dihydrofolate reductase
VRELAVIEFLTLDGVMQGLGSADEDREGGFEYGGWSAPYGDEVLGQKAGEGMAETTAYLFGRKTYEKMAAFWPTAPKDDPYAQHLNSTRKYVASTTLDSVDWEPSTLIKDDVAGAVADLKTETGGNIAVLGSGQLVQTLIAHDLVDEYFLAVYPLVLGSGKRLFGELDHPAKLRLVDSKTTTTGGLLLTYRPVEETR